MRSMVLVGRSRMRAAAVGIAVALALVASFFVVPSASALSDTGDGGLFVPATARILDTGNGTGGYNTVMPAKQWRTIKVAGQAGLPADGIAAVSVMATVVNPSTNGNLQGRPDSSTQAALLLNYGGINDQNFSNTGILAVADDGTIQLMTEQANRLIIDVQGYYTSSENGTAAGGFVPVPGKRVLDTRSGVGVPAASLGNGQSITAQITGQNGVPAGATAVAANFIVVNQTTTSGFITPYAAGSTKPSNSLNYPGDARGLATSIGAQVGLSAAGKLSITATTGTGGAIDVIVDIQGYFTKAEGGAVFTPAAARIADTRVSLYSVVQGGAEVSIPVAGVKGIPASGSGLTAVAMTLSAINGSSTGGSAVVWPDGTAAPATTSINYVPSNIRSNTVIAQVGTNGKIRIKNNGANPIHFILDLQGWFSNPMAPVIVCPTNAAQSWTTSLPASPVTCSATVDSSVGGSELAVMVDGEETGRVAVDGNGKASLSTTVASRAGWHTVSAYLISSDEALWSYSTYQFGLFDRQPSALLASVQRASSEAFEDLADVIPTASGSTAVQAGDTDSASVPTTSSGKVRMVSVSGADNEARQNVATGLPFSGQAAQAVVEGPGVVSFNNRNGTSTVPVVHADGSIQILTVIANASAPRSFAYPVEIPTDSTMTLAEDGSVAITMADGTDLASFGTPWAIDANGISVPTKFEVSGNTLTQVVMPAASTAFPVVADPKYTTTTYYFSRSEVELLWKRKSQIDSWCKILPTKYLIGLSCQIPPKFDEAINQAHYQKKRIKAVYHNCARTYCNYYTYTVVP